MSMPAATTAYNAGANQPNQMLAEDSSKEWINIAKSGNNAAAITRLVLANRSRNVAHQSKAPANAALINRKYKGAARGVNGTESSSTLASMRACNSTPGVVLLCGVGTMSLSPNAVYPIKAQVPSSHSGSI